MLLGLCWSNLDTLKTLMNDLRIALSQIRSFNLPKKIADLHHCLVNLVVLIFCKNGMCTKLKGNEKGFPI